jgi:hypothetical protein
LLHTTSAAGDLSQTASTGSLGNKLCLTVSFYSIGNLRGNFYGSAAIHGDWKRLQLAEAFRAADFRG